MDLRDLTYFETIAELEHLGRAAQKLNRSQPALTKAIQRLEESLAAKLFQRDGRRIKLTAAGELLLARSRQLQQSVADTRREVRDFASGVVGIIRLGCAASMAEYLLPQMTAALLERAPDISLKLSIGQDDVLRESLRAGRLDMMVGPLGADNADLICHHLLDDELIVVASPHHPIFRQPYELSDLCRYRWVLPPPGVSARNWIDSVFLSRQLPAPHAQIETNSISLMPRLIARTNLLSFLARETLEHGKGKDRLIEVPMAQTTMQRTLGISLRSGGYVSPATEAMVQMLQEHGRSFFRPT